MNKRHRLEIVMNYDITAPINASDTTIYLDGDPIGCVQNIKIDIGVKKEPRIEVTLPNFHSKHVDSNFKTPFIKDIACHEYNLSKIPNVKIIMKDIGLLDDKLEEIGTDGCIEHIKLVNDLQLDLDGGVLV